KKDNNNGDLNSEDNLKYPPGFTPATDVDVQDNTLDELDVEGDNHIHNIQDDKVESAEKKNSPFNSSKNDTDRFVCSGQFKKCEIPSSGGSILQLMDELIKVGQTMGYNMESCLAHKAKKDWVRKLCCKNKVNFLSLQETKMEDILLFNIKLCWGNFGFEYEYSPSVGNLGGILCIWDPSMFRKINSTISDSFVMIQGEWVPNGKKIIIISVYAPQELCEKKMLWDYLILVLNNWNSEVVITGDFNEEVHMQEERRGSIFNVQSVHFNCWIGGGPFRWVQIHMVPQISLEDE
ncbi:RNA-directed DNA polymerase, eukaryota, partial [Tanacetum coccineum]